MCCRGAWVVVTPAEVERYRALGASRWYTDIGAQHAVDPFDPVAHGHFRIRKRADGACGFLSEANRCRIHEELGGEAKPLACRVFPFRFQSAAGRPFVATSASCPTIVRNEGEALAAQLKSLTTLRGEWMRAFPRKDGGLFFARGRPIDAATVNVMKGALVGILDSAGADSTFALAGAVERMARWLEDLSRHRVARLKSEGFTEYVALTGRHAAASEADPAPARASVVTRLLARGFLFTVVAVRDQLASEAGGPRRHLRRIHQLAHLHGLAPATGSLDRRARDRVTIDPADAEVRRIVADRLRANVDALGTGQRPLVDEIGVESATLAAGLELAAMTAHRAGASRIDAATVTSGITAAAQLAHADTGALGTLLPTLAGGPDALRLVAAWLRPAL